MIGRDTEFDAGGDFSLIDLPRIEPIDDPHAYLQAAVRWHFSPDTGSRYWLKRAEMLDFNPLTDVKTFEDLALFPNIVDELRDVDVRDLVPAGYGPNAPMPAVYESGGLDDLVNEPTVTNVYSGHHPTYEWTAPDPPRRLPGRLPDGQQGLHPRLTSTSNRRSGLTSPDMPFLAADATRQFRANASEDIAS